jgi:hypothetical protein
MGSIDYFDVSKAETYHRSIALNTLGNCIQHCGNNNFKRESKSFVSKQRDKKFLLEIDFMVIILRVYGRGILVGISKYIRVFFTCIRIK